MTGDEPFHILIIDDDERLRDLTGRFLGDQGFRVSTAASAEEARAHLEVVRFDLMVVDIMMPGESGLDLVRSLKSGSGAPPCLMLTAMGKPGERLHGLESGADDYMTKPFEPLELALRIRNLLGRRPPDEASAPVDADAGPTVAFGPHRFETQRQVLTTGGRRQHLTSAEKNLLSCFCTDPGGILSRGEISKRLGGQMTGRSIDVAIARLRRKIEPNPGKPIYLLTARGQGWMLDTDSIGGAAQ